MIESEIKKEFKEQLEYLNKEKGLTLVAISKATGIDLQKLRNINTGRSSGNSQLLMKLRETYAGLLKEEDANGSASDHSSREAELLAEVERLKKLVAEKEARILKLIDMGFDKSRDGERR